ncbi:unnamed protein product [Rotaria magnacalcarata]|uniref:F-box/LRR-repeat protein 15-like leucin rich repeat domain-containing protein n=1 Tax=Rotaria magnacalcarata TaxID=392030 RepID=A0A814LF45_9BILA|nr:unnamed protein product [Rotaria magnacalcarata]CAF1267925.1 unnamed protein product [Rotaria magnacalcarata]CAF2050159.1 unnamed protein product [Rotaria magnacalcarata]CAF2087689.1 unnamed protein product [Rotaria magnacalcarata]CAF2118413.1 unnamed protein product [Rotaria magnacalcarata]
MAFACTRPKTKDDSNRNIQLEKRINQSSMENIDLSNLNLTDQDVPFINRKVIKKKKSTTLSLANNKITPNGIQMLVDALKKNKNFTHLILSSNPIGDEGLKYITELVNNNQTLYHLSLNDTDITDRGIEMITSALGSNSASLRCLDLRSNKYITDSSVDFLLEMVDHNETLSACRLDNCSLSQQAKEKLREAKSIRW